MTFGSLLNSNFGNYKGSIHERGEHYAYPPPPWKGNSKGGKGTQSALSALTLLAFLFFLNILQSCLRDQLASQTPLTIMMTTQTTTTTTEAVRHKRDTTTNQHTKGDQGEISGSKKTNITYHNNRTNTYTGNFKFNNEMKSKKMSWLTSDFSPWLKSIFCCNVFYCPIFKTKNENKCY